MKGQKQDVLANIQSRIMEGTSQFTNLTERLRQIQITMGEQGMQSRRSRHTIITETKKICVATVSPAVSSSNPNERRAQSSIESN